MQAEARATIQRLLGYSELSNELNVYQFSLQAELGYQLDQQRALLSLIPTDIQGWTTEDWILAKNVTQTLFGGFHFHMHLLALIEAKLGQAVTHTHVQDQLDYLASDTGPFQKLLSLMYLAKLSTDDAKVAYEKLDSPEAIRRAMTLYQEMEPYWRENRFGVELNSDWFIERVMTP